MPEMHFRVEWPNGRVDDCYSPSWVIEEHLAVGEAYPVAEFVARAKIALEIGSERVRAKYGFACSSALDQLARIEEAAEGLLSDERETGRVKVLAFDKHEPRNPKQAG
jgi:uncharacterized repeat protein (TIGR04042 family)